MGESPDAGCGQEYTKRTSYFVAEKMETDKHKHINQSVGEGLSEEADLPPVAPSTRLRVSAKFLNLKYGGRLGMDYLISSSKEVKCREIDTADESEQGDVISHIAVLGQETGAVGFSKRPDIGCRVEVEVTFG